MRSYFGIALLILSSRAFGVDLCPSYATLHEREIIPRIRSGIPFKLLGVAIGNDGTVQRRALRVEYDLWKEKVTVEVIGQGRETVGLSKSQDHICRALSFPGSKTLVKHQYRLFLNPVLENGLERLRSTKGTDSAGFLKIDWGRLVKDIETEKILLEREFTP